VTSGCADAAGRNPRAGRAHRALGQARAWGQAIRRAGGLRYLQVIPVAVLLWALDAVDRFRGGARAAGLAHAGVVSEMSSLAGGAVALPVNHWLAGHAGLGAIAAGYYIVLHGLAAYSLISKKIIENRIEFKDLMGSMVNFGGDSFNSGDEPEEG